jgi:hypothetical protein
VKSNFGLFIPLVPHQHGCVPDTSSSTFLILSIASVGLLAFLFGLLLGVSRRLARIEQLIAAVLESRSELVVGGGAEEGAAADVSSGSVFEAFLSEDPGRRSLTKKEQFAAYRSWRQEKGLNWSSSGDS